MCLITPQIKRQQLSHPTVCKAREEKYMLHNTIKVRVT
jgi:hypothetical protein